MVESQKASPSEGVAHQTKVCINVPSSYNTCACQNDFINCFITMLVFFFFFRPSILYWHDWGNQFIAGNDGVLHWPDELCRRKPPVFYFILRSNPNIFLSSFQLIRFHLELDVQTRMVRKVTERTQWPGQSVVALEPLKHLVAAELLGTATELGPGMTWEDEHWKKGTSKLLYQKPTIPTFYQIWPINMVNSYWLWSYIKILWLMSLPWKNMCLTPFPITMLCLFYSFPGYYWADRKKTLWYIGFGWVKTHLFNQIKC